MAPVTKIHLYCQSGGASDYKVLRLASDQERLEGCRQIAIKMLRKEGHLSAADRLANGVFLFYEGTNHFGDEFLMLYSEVDVDSFYELRLLRQDPQALRDFKEIAEFLTELLPGGLRHVAIGLDLRRASAVDATPAQPKVDKKGTSSMPSEAKVFEYDVCLSFAGEDREYVERVADCLRRMKIRVFYDKYEEANLWGRDLYTHLDHVYRELAQFCVVFVSVHYAKKLWTNHELRSAQTRAFTESSEYVLPAKFDDTTIPGIQPTVGYVDLRHKTPDEVAAMLRRKLGYAPDDVDKKQEVPPARAVSPMTVSLSGVKSTRGGFVDINTGAPIADLTVRRGDTTVSVGSPANSPESYVKVEGDTNDPLVCSKCKRRSRSLAAKQDGGATEYYECVLCGDSEVVHPYENY